MRRGQHQDCRSPSSLASQLDLARREGLVLHHHGAAAGQNHDVQVLLFFMGVLVPLPHHLRVVCWDEGYLEDRAQKITSIPKRTKQQ